MSELKTLKDINTICDDVCPYECNSVQIIREEAIKWIKELGKRIDEYNEFKHNNSTCLWNESIIEWIKDFFNITEEELR